MITARGVGRRRSIVISCNDYLTNCADKKLSHTSLSFSLWDMGAGVGDHGAGRRLRLLSIDVIRRRGMGRSRERVSISDDGQFSNKNSSK